MNAPGLTRGGEHEPGAAAAAFLSCYSVVLGCTYCASISSASTGSYPVDSIFARSRTLLRGRGATGPVAVREVLVGGNAGHPIRVVASEGEHLRAMSAHDVTDPDPVTL